MPFGTIVFIAGLLAMTQVKAQEPTNPLQPLAADSTYELIFHAVEEMPEFPGGEEALDFYVEHQLQTRHIGKKLSGKVGLRFAIDEEGQVIRLSVIKSLSPELDAEAVRVMKAMPCWEPGRQNNKRVKVWLEYDVRFRKK